MPHQIRALIDTSARIWVEQNLAEEAAQDLMIALDAGTIATCAPVRLEVLRGASSLERFDEMAMQFNGLAEALSDEDVCPLASDTQRALAMRPGSKHRSTPATDLLIAPAAIEANMPLIHRDHDFETTSQRTHQPLRWIGPR